MTVIAHIRDQILSDRLRPGDRLPSERELCETLKVSRGYVRKAIVKLNHIGLIETLPQKGTIVAGFSGRAISGLLSSIGNLDGSFDPIDLFEVRSNLESFSARQAALRAGRAELEAIESWHSAFRAKVETGVRALEEDHLFHLAIAKASGNAVCFALVCYITPQILALAAKGETSTQDRLTNTYEEHDRIVKAILSGDPAGAEAAMREHMEEAWKRRTPDSESKRT
ncbi:MAG TPA: FadR/GntR family transcriptional regulator [Rectinemataceae bacterium]|nr:FadR/GntR family transcriptional regulator [Rectinemataceae bacterium]